MNPIAEDNVCAVNFSAIFRLVRLEDQFFLMMPMPINKVVEPLLFKNCFTVDQLSFFFPFECMIVIALAVARCPRHARGKPYPKIRMQALVGPNRNRVRKELF